MTSMQREVRPNSSWAVTWREFIVPLLAPANPADDTGTAWSGEAGIVGAYRRPRHDMPWRWGD